MKKIIAVCLLLALAVALTGCYAIKAASEQEILGTYELTTYTCSVTKEKPATETEGEDAEPGSETENLIETHGIVSYLVVSSKTSGYYYYKDNETEAKCYAVSITLTEATEPEDEGKFTYLTFTYDGQTVKLGIKTQSFFSNTRLNVTMPSWTGNLIKGNVRYAGSTHTVFVRKSNKTDLSFLEKKVGSVTVIPIAEPSSETDQPAE